MMQNRPHTEGGRPGETYEISRLLVGLDLGQSTDYSAIAIVRQQIGTKYTGPTGWWRESRLSTAERKYTIQYLSRWPLGTPYTQVVAELAALMVQLTPESRWIGSPAAEPPHKGTIVIAYDQTGLGAVVGDVMKAAGIRATGIVIGSGQTDSALRPGTMSVPKEHLLTNLLILLEQSRLKAASPDLADLDTLMAEMSSYTRRQSGAAGQTYSSNQHSDLLMAVSIAAYAGRLADQAEKSRAARQAIANAWRT